MLDILPRRFGDRLGALPDADAARAQLAATIMRSAVEISAADVSAVIGCTRKEAGMALDRLTAEGRARSRDAGDYILWMSAGRSRSRTN